MGTAGAQSVEKPALVAIFMGGGYSSLFGSADSFLQNGYFGVNSGNVEDLGNGLMVDAVTLGSMPSFAKQHCASIGIGQMGTDHAYETRRAFTDDNDRAYALMLANAMGGDGAIKCAAVGGRPGQIFEKYDPPAEGGVSYQDIYDMEATIRALGGGEPDLSVPDRDIAAKALAASRAMSGTRIAANTQSLKSVKDGYDTVIDTLRKPVKPFTFADLASGYGRSTTDYDVYGEDDGNAFKSKFMAAELMIMAGANVVTMETGFMFDLHGQDGSADRDNMASVVMPGLNIFLERMLALEDRNVVVAMFGEFGRSTPSNDHQPNMTATVIGKYVKVGTTGKCDGDAGLPNNTPGRNAFWSFLASAVKAPTNPFGSNPHPLIL